jgi:hypothetical protein
MVMGLSETKWPAEAGLVAMARSGLEMQTAAFWAAACGLGS